MNISFILLAITAIVTIINVWQSVKKGELSKKALYINILLTLFACLAFGLSWKEQEDEKEQLRQEKAEQKRQNDSAYARLESTYHNTIALYNLTDFINHSVDTVKLKTDSITHKTIELNNQSRRNFIVTLNEQRRLLAETRRMQYHIPNDMYLNCNFFFKYDSVSNLFEKLIASGKYVPRELYRNSILNFEPAIDSISTFLLNQIRSFTIQLDFVRKIPKQYNFTDLYVSGRIDLMEPKREMLIQLFYYDKKFQVNIMHMPIKISKNNNVPFISDLINSTVYVNNSFCEKLYNVNTFMDSYYDKPKGIGPATFNSFWIDFGVVVSENHSPQDTLTVPVIKSFKLKSLMD